MTEKIKGIKGSAEKADRKLFSVLNSYLTNDADNYFDVIKWTIFVLSIWFFHK